MSGNQKGTTGKEWLAVVFILFLPAVFVAHYFYNKSQSKDYEEWQGQVEHEHRSHDESVYRNSVEGIASRTKVQHDPYKRQTTFLGPSGQYSWATSYHSGYDFSLAARSDDATHQITYQLSIEINKGNDLLEYFIELNGDRYDLTAVSSDGGLPAHYGYTTVSRAHLEDKSEDGIKLRAYTASNDHWDIEIDPKYIQGFLKAVDDHAEASVAGLSVQGH